MILRLLTYLTDDQFGPWGPWTLCSATCEAGEQTRVRVCQNDPCRGEDQETVTCNNGRCRK